MLPPKLLTLGHQESRWLVSKIAQSQSGWQLGSATCRLGLERRSTRPKCHVSTTRHPDLQCYLGGVLDANPTGGGARPTAWKAQPAPRNWEEVEGWSLPQVMVLSEPRLTMLRSPDPVPR